MPMKTTITTLLCISTLVTGLAAQEGRRPVDISIEGVDDLSLVTQPSLGGGPPIGCLSTIRDQATSNCLMASSTATSGVLYPYPGVGNVFTAPAFVGSGTNNVASGTYSFVGGGEDNQAGGPLM